MKKTLLSLLIAVFLSISGYSQETITIGESTLNTNKGVLPGYYGYHYSAVMYPTDELEGLSSGASITSIAYQVASASSTSGASMKVYLKEADELSGSSTWTELKQDATLVYDGEVGTVTSNAWYTIEFTTPYSYGGNNLIVLIEGEGCTTSGECGSYVYYTTSTDNAFLGLKDYTKPDTTVSINSNSFATSTNNYKPNTQITYIGGSGSYCYSVKNLQDSVIDAENVNVWWSEVEESTGYQYQLKLASEEWDSTGADINSVSDTMVELTELTANTNYTLRVRNVCSSDFYSSWKTVTFKTACVFLTEDNIPYIMDPTQEETGYGKLPSCWTRLNTTNTNYPYLNTSGYLYMYYNNAVALNGYTGDISALQLSFLAKPGSNTTSYGTVEVGIMTDLTNDSTYTSIKSIAATSYSSSSWKKQEVPFTDYELSDDVETYYVVIKHTEPSNWGYAWSLSDITLEHTPNCIAAQDIKADTITAESATISWTAGDETTDWTIYYWKDGDTDTLYEIASDTLVELINLEAQTTYNFYIVTDCEGYKPKTTTYYFKTQCSATEVTDENPFVVNISYDGLYCWTKNDWSYSTYSGGYLYTSSSSDLILPTLDIESVTTPYLKIKHRNTSSQLKVYSRASADDDWSDIYTLDIASDTVTDLIALSNASSTYQIKIANMGSSYAYLYNVEVYNEENPPSCNKAMDVQVNATSSTAVITWSQPDDASSWILYYKTDADESYTATDELTDTTYTMDVEPQTTYSIYVATVCGADESSYPTTSVITFTTPCVGLTLQDLPYTWDFDSNNVATTSSYYKLPSCWQKLGSYPHAYGSSYYAHSGDTCLYFSAYTTPYGILPFVDVENAPINTLQISLYAINSSSYNDATLAIGVMTDPTNKSTFVVVDSTDLTSSYTLYEFPLSSYQGQGGYIAIRISSDDYAYVYIDDVTLQEIPSCIKPQGLAASNITTSSATISWAQGGEVTTWNLYYKESTEENYTEVSNLTEMSYDLTLEDSKTYSVYVEAVCDNDSTIATNPITFKTPCPALTADDLPYTMDFENETSGEIPACWTAIQTYTTSYGTYPRVYTYSAYEGSKDFYMYYNCSAAIKPYQGDISALQLSLQAKPGYNSSSYGTLEIGVQTDLSDATTYQSVKVYNATDWASSAYEKLIIPFDSIEADASATYYVVIKHTEPYNSGYAWYIDDVKLEVIPSCAEATNITATSITGTSLTISWTQPDESDSWTVFYKAESEEDYQSLVANDTTIEILDLTPQTNYSVYIQTNCTGDQPSTSPITFKTECDDNGITISDEYTYTQDFESTDESKVPDCWSKVIEATSGNTFSGASTYTKNSGSKSLVMKASPACTQPMIALPKFSNSLSELRVKFYSKSENTTSSGDLEFGYITNITDSSTFVVLTSFPNTDNTWTLRKIDLNAYEEQLSEVTNARLAFRHNDPTLTSSWYYYAVDDLEVLLIPACQEPNDVVVSPESSSASITWTSDASSFNIVVKDEDDTEIANETGYSTTQYDLYELTPNTTYTISITGICSDNTLTPTTTATFTTPCVSLTEEDLPYETNFDNETTSTIPSCWTKVSGTSAYYPEVSSVSSYSSSNSLRIAYNNTAIALQPYEGDISALRLTMYVRPTGTFTTYGTLQVGIQTDLSDSSTFTMINEITATEWTTYSIWQKREIDFDSYQGTSSSNTYYVVIKHTNPTTYAYSWYIDDVTLGKIPACPPAKNLEISNISTDGATLSWTQGGESVTSWIIKYKDENSDTWEETSSVNSDTTVTLSGLSSSTTYEVYIEGECSDAEEGNPISDTITFATTCTAITITNDDTYTQDFENGTINEAPLCWTKVVESTSSNLSGINTYKYEGSYSLVLKASSYCTQPMIALPEFTNDLSELRVKFYSKSESSTSSGDLELGYITDVTDSSTFVVLTSFPNTETTWTLHKIDLNTYATQLSGVTNARLAFRHNDPSISSSWYYYAVDNLEVCLTPACQEPNDVTVDSITENSAVITWTSTATKFNLTVKNGDQVVVSQTNIQAHTYTVTGLSATTTYKVSVQSVCDDGSTTETTTATFTTACGTITVTNTSAWNADLTSIDCWTMDNASDWDIYGTALVHEYGKYSPDPDDIYTPTLDISNVTAPAVTLTYTLKDYMSSNIVNTLTVLYRADSTDNWTELKSYNTLVTDAVDTIALPNKSATYQLNLRWSDYNIDADGIEISALKVFNNSSDTTTPANPCVAPTSLTASNIAQTTATVSWVGTASSYDVQLNNNAVETVTTTSKQFTGLTANTTYTVKVRSNCGTTTSDWATTTFTTLEDTPAPCNAPTNLEVVPTSNSLTLSWSGDATAYDVQINDETVQTTQQTIFTFANLTPSTTYSLKVRSNCGNEVSDWATITGTTNAEATGDQDPVVTTNNATAGETTATLNAVVSVNGNTITKSGFNYRQMGDSEWIDVEATIESSGLMSVNIDGLTPETTYEYQAYVVTDKGTFKGTVKSFTTEPSGLTDVENIVNILTYPNPTTTNATLEINGLMEDANIILTDVNGRVVFKDIYSVNQSSITISTESLPAGVYYIRVVNNNITKTQTLIKK